MAKLDVNQLLDVVVFNDEVKTFQNLHQLFRAAKATGASQEEMISILEDLAGVLVLKWKENNAIIDDIYECIMGYGYPEI